MLNIIAFIAGIAVVLALLSLKNFRRFYLPNWLLHVLGETPWSPGVARHMRAVPSGGLQPTHEVYFVARQDIAECGVSCPKCSTDVAERGDFTRVTRSFVDGQENEVIKCQGLIDLQDGQRPQPCPAWLAASPNTEHGDDLIEGDPKEFYVFSRVTQAQALREKYGMEISADDACLLANPQARPAGAVPGENILDAVFVPFADTVVQAQQANREKIDAIDVGLASKPARPAVSIADEETRILPTIAPPKDT